MRIQTGSQLGGYRVGALLGEGATSTTWRAVRIEDGADRALKVVHNQDAVYGERIRRAAEAQRRLAHPNLVHVDEVLDAGGAPALVMEFVPGGPLEAWIPTRPSIGEALAVFEQIAKGVGAAHDQGVVHRNLKPGKILLDGSAPPVPKVTDFTLVKLDDGAAKLTQMGTSFGTPQYMAPEQFRNVSGVDARADLFALGAILFELVTGRRAFDGVGIIDCYQQVAAKAHPDPKVLNPDLPQPVVATIDRLLDPDPAKRPASVTETLQLLFGSGELEPLVAPHRPRPKAAAPPPPVEEDEIDLSEPTTPAKRSLPGPMLVALVLAMGLVIGAFVWSLA